MQIQIFNKDTKRKINVDSKEFPSTVYANCVEVPIELYEKDTDWDKTNQVLIEKPVDIEELRKNAHAVNTAKHLEFQNQVFPIIIKRGNAELPDLTLYFNCTDDTRWNIQSAYDVAKEDGQVYFYDGRGVGDYLSESEMTQAITQFKNKLNPSFVTKGQTKLAINQATSVEQLNNIIKNIIY